MHYLLWFCSKDETTDFNANNVSNNSFKSFKYKAKLVGNTVAYPLPNAADGFLTNATIAVPLKDLSNSGDRLKCHRWIAEYNENLDGQNIVFCLWLVMKMRTIIVIMVIILFLLSKTQKIICSCCNSKC